MEKNIKISLVASSIRPLLWKDFYSSLLSNHHVDFEIIFVGNAVVDHNLIKKQYPKLKYIETSVKPSQCYEIGFRHSTGELIHWTADDATYEAELLDRFYEYYMSKGDYKLILEPTTVENGRDCTDHHHFFGGQHETPVMAPFGFMSKKLMLEIGGYDRRFITGQSENDLIMRAYEVGAKVEIMKDRVFVNHGKHKNGESVFRAGENGFYHKDRKVLESCWCQDGKVSSVRLDELQSFDDHNILLETQGEKGKW